MDSIVLELQGKALAKEADVAELVRMARVVARKLQLSDFERWTELELSGYGQETLPEYRIVQAEVKAHNPYHGWIPVVFESSATAEAASEAPCNNPIGELQFIVTDRKHSGYLHQPFSDDITRTLMQNSGVRLVPTRLIGLSRIVGILDAVRNMVLNWALELEQTGILGEGLTFSAAEKEKAASAPSIHITNFQGVLGDVQAEQLQIGDYASVHQRLKELGLSQKDRNELENILDDLKVAKGRKKASLAKRGRGSCLLLLSGREGEGSFRTLDSHNELSGCARRCAGRAVTNRRLRICSPTT